MVRYNADGTLDNTFGGDGSVTTDIGLATTDYGLSVALQPDGKIVVSGHSYIGSWDSAVVRYNTDGTLDNTFGGDGKVITALGSTQEGCYAVALQPDGKILLAGGSEGDFAVVRYNADGTLDNTFGGDGMVTTDIGGDPEWGWALVLQPDGKVVVSGQSTLGTGDFAVVRYNADGTLDNAFGGDGMVTTDFYGHVDVGRSVAVLLDGKILVAGLARSTTSDGLYAVVRYNADGTLDGTFGTGGKVSTDLSSGYCSPRCVSIATHHSKHSTKTEIVSFRISVFEQNTEVGCQN